MNDRDILKKFYDQGLEIIRLKPDDKRPLERWKDVPKRNFDVVERWLKSNSNFGAVLGSRSDGIVVVDLDQPELYHQYFKDVETLVVKTPKKGYHIYLKSPKKQAKIPGYLFKPIDLQANGSYVVIPPSKIGTNQYEVIKDKPILSVKDPEQFLKDRLKEMSFAKTVDCRDLATKELGEAEVDSGRYLQFMCPFHADNETPSFTAYEDGFKCFGCGWSGSAQDFLLQLGKDVDKVFEYLEKHGVDIWEEINLQTKRQKQLQALTGMMMAKYPMVTDAKTSKGYIYFPPRNVWKEIYGDGFFKQLIYETTGHPVLDDEVDIIIQYIFNPKVEDSDWIAFNNKLVNIETGEVRNPTSEIFTTTHINYDYREDADGGEMDKALREILCDEKDGDKKYKFFFQMVGYFFTGTNRYNKMFFITGSGANGKSTLMAIIRKIFDGYTSSQQLQNLSQDFGLQPLIGKKINIVYDMSSRALNDIGTLKAITGEDTVTVNIKNAPQITLKLPTKIIATGNILPQITEANYAFYRRVVHLELKNTFPNPDTRLPYKLVNDKDGMEWVIHRSIQEYLKVDNDGWAIEQDIESVEESYQKLADPLKWVTMKLFEAGSDEDYLSGDTIYNAMKDKLESEGMVVPSRSKNYYKDIRNMGAEATRKRIDGDTVRVWQGIRFKMPELEAELRGLL